MIIEIELINIGREKICKKIKETANTDDIIVAIQSAEVQAFDECKEHVMSSDCELVPENYDDYTDCNNYGFWVGGLRKVGRVIIRKIK